MKQFTFLRTLLALALILFSQNIYSQVGIKIGVTSIKHSGVELQAGLQYEFGSDKKVFAATEVLYSRYKEVDPAFPFRSATEFLTFPILAKFHCTDNFLFVSGAQMGFTINHKVGGIFSFSPALVAGVEYHCYKGLALTGRYVLSDVENLQIACTFSLNSLKGK
jgi:hypothetical protein